MVQDQPRKTVSEILSRKKTNTKNGLPKWLKVVEYHQKQNKTTKPPEFLIDKK
jgi:hypothetical protein